MDKPKATVFASINLMPDRSRVRGGLAPLVRARFWLGLAAAVTLLIVAMGVQLLPMLVPR